MLRIFALSAVCTGVLAQRNANMDDLENASKAFRQAGEAYATAAQSLKTATASASQSGCVKDATTGECVSFLKKGFLQPLVARVMGSDVESSGELERKTQSPLVFMHLHSSFVKDPVFPGAAEGASSTIAGALSTAANGQDRSGESALIAKAISSGSSKLAARVASQMNLAALRKDAFIAVHMRVRKMLHNGGCPRDMSGCPVGFVSSGNGCEPGASYSGLCGARDFSGMSQASKEEWAFKCGAGWPCA